jgi:hypothetical protein
MEDVYGRPYDAAEPVVCLDEKSVNFDADIRPLVPPCRAERLAWIANTSGAAPPTILGPSNPRQADTSPLPRPAGMRLNSCASCAIFAMEYPEGKTIHLVMDNLNTHNPEVADGEIWDRYAVHYTPKHGSWLNQAEIEISLFARQCLGGRRILDLTRSPIERLNLELQDESSAQEDQLEI